MYNLNPFNKGHSWGKARGHTEKGDSCDLWDPSPSQTPWHGHRCGTGRVQPRGHGNTQEIKNEETVWMREEEDRHEGQSLHLVGWGNWGPRAQWVAKTLEISTGYRISLSAAKPGKNLGPCWWAESAFPSSISINIYWYSCCVGFYGRPWGCRNGRDIISILETRLVEREKKRPVYLRNCGTQMWVEPERDALARMVKSCVLGLIALQSIKRWSCKYRDLSSIPRTQVKNARRRLGTGKMAQPLGAHAFVEGLGLIPSAHTMAHSHL